jgi:hypothetical protein
VRYYTPRTDHPAQSDALDKHFATSMAQEMLL